MLYCRVKLVIEAEVRRPMALRHDLAALLFQAAGHWAIKVPGELRFAGQDLPAPGTGPA
jgi:hypothetical protein